VSLFYLFAIYLMTLPVASNIQHQMVELRVNNVWKGCGRNSRGIIWDIILESTWVDSEKRRETSKGNQCQPKFESGSNKYCRSTWVT